MSKKGEVVKGFDALEWMLDNGKNLVAVGCHHKKGTNACGGCYARLDNAIDDALKALGKDEFQSFAVSNAIAILQATIDQRKAEKKR